MSDVAPAMDQRWSFMLPWCEVLKPRIGVQSCTCDDDDYEYSWTNDPLLVTVELPQRRNVGVEKDEASFRQEFQKVQEALLAAVEHVDYHAYNYLLVECCEVRRYERDISQPPISAKFSVAFDVAGNQTNGIVEYDLVRLCGTHLNLYPSEEYLSALKQIGIRDGSTNTKPHGVCIEIPVMLDCTYYMHEHYRYIRYDELSINYGDGLEAITKAEKEIAKQWEAYNKNAEEESLSRDELHCKFVLEPISADLSGIHWKPEVAQALEHKIFDNVRFSQLKIELYIDRERVDNELVARKSFGLLLRRIFDSTRRNQNSAHINYNFNGDQNSQPSQIDVLNVQCAEELSTWDFTAMCSAMVLTQTTKKVTLVLDIDKGDQTNREHWWKWLAYSLFSKRARACSSLETLTIVGSERLNASIGRAFASVLESEHPEELLLGTPRGVVDERDATLKSNSPIRWEFDDLGEPVVDSSHLSFEYPIEFIRTFSDDGKSEWINVLVPGFGRCQVQRSHLEFSAATNNDSGGVTTLTLRAAGVLEGLGMTGVQSLVPFLDSFGLSLTALAILESYDTSWDDFDGNAIIRCCPNLQELTLSRELVDIQLDFTEYRAAKEATPEWSFAWTDVSTVAKSLSDLNNPLAKCTRRLKACLQRTEIADRRLGTTSNFKSSVGALFDMLEVNERLEYLMVESRCTEYEAAFKKFDGKPIYRQREPLPTKCKVAFLSVRSINEQQCKPLKRCRTMVARERSLVEQMDQHVLVNIFAFAALPVIRGVYYEYTA